MLHCYLEIQTSCDLQTMDVVKEIRFNHNLLYLLYFFIVIFPTDWHCRSHRSW